MWPRFLEPFLPDGKTKDWLRIKRNANEREIMRKIEQERKPKIVGTGKWVGAN